MDTSSQCFLNGRFRSGFCTNYPWFIVLEYLDGVSLDRDIIDNSQPLDRVARIIIQICDALSIVHKNGVIHRDLKPENIFLVSRGHDPDFVKILDFGIAKVEGPLSGQPSLITSPGMAIGTPGYMSPEQCEGSPNINYLTDIHALGAILFYSLTGQCPFYGQSLQELMFKTCTESPRSILDKDLRPDLPAAIDAIIQKAMAKEPEDRFLSALEFKRVLFGVVWPNYHEPIGYSSIPPSSSYKARTVLESEPDEELSLPKRTWVSKRWLIPLSIGVVAVAIGAFSVIQDLRNRQQSEAIPRSNAIVTSINGLKAEQTNTGDKRTKAMVHVTIKTDPENAQVYIDSERVRNPYNKMLPLGNDKRIIKAVLEGYRTVEESLVPNRDHEIRFTLEPQREPIGTDISTKHKTSTSTRGARVRHRKNTFQPGVFSGGHRS